MLRQSMCSYQIMEIGRVPNAHLLSPNKTFSIRIRLHLVGFLAEGFTQESTKKYRLSQKQQVALKNIIGNKASLLKTMPIYINKYGDFKLLFT